MKKDQRFVIIKAIPLKDGKSIPVNTSIYRTHGMYYMDGGLLPQDYQEDFDDLISQEEKSGWKYISPVTITEAWRNDREEI